jgi:hypothetical protein
MSDRKKPAIKRFWAKIEVQDNGCWNFAGAETGNYGRFYDGTKCGYAHRFAYRHFIGEIPEGMELDHLCRNKRCCNPNHLEPVTHQENVRRGIPFKKVW